MENLKSCWHWLLLGLLGVGLLGLFANYWSKTPAKARMAADSVAQEALDSSGHQNLSAKVEGPVVVVRGAAASFDAKEMACNAVRQDLQAKNMVGLPGVVRAVDCKVTAPGEPVVAQAPAAAPAASKAIPAAAKAEATACGERLNTAAKSGKITFALQRAEIASGQPVLDQVASIAKECSRFAIEIGGHTDSRGGDAINVPLSQARAETVRQYLVSKGVPATQLSAKGYGSQRPILPGSDQPENRRTEFVITALN